MFHSFRIRDFLPAGLSLTLALAAVLPAQETEEVAAVPPPTPAAEQPAEGADGEGGAAEAPAPERLEYDLPFSLQDCQDLIASARAAVIAKQKQERDYADDSVLGLLQTVSSYLRERDSLSSRLLDYEWDEIAMRPVTSGLPRPEELLFDPSEEGRQVNALSFEVRDADARLHALEVYSRGDELVGPFSEEVTLRHSLPRRYVFHLYRPTDIRRISMSVSQIYPQRQETPLIVIHAGRTDEPEHGKAAIHHIWKAETRIREGRLESAGRHLAEAGQAIRSYRRYLRDEL